jgi:hypothetical protein
MALSTFTSSLTGGSGGTYFTNLVTTITEDSICNIHICNLGNQANRFSLIISEEADIENIPSNDYIIFEYELENNDIFRITDVNVKANEIIYVKMAGTSAVARVELEPANNIFKWVDISPEVQLGLYKKAEVLTDSICNIHICNWSTEILNFDLYISSAEVTDLTDLYSDNSAVFNEFQLSINGTLALNDIKIKAGENVYLYRRSGLDAVRVDGKGII